MKAYERRSSRASHMSRSSMLSSGDAGRGDRATAGDTVFTTEGDLDRQLLNASTDVPQATGT